MKTVQHTIALPDGAKIPATITVYGIKDATLPQHDDLYRPSFGVWGVGQIDHQDFRNRAWLVSSDSTREILNHLRAEVDFHAREHFGYAPVSPYLLYLMTR